MSKSDLILESIPEVKKLIELGKINHEVTYDEINEILPDKLLNSDKIDDIFILLNQLGIEVVEESTRKSTIKIEKKKKTSAPKKAATVHSDASHVDDPIRLYLKEIGKVSLLSGDQEVDLAKRIEEGEILIEKAVINSTLLINDLIKNFPKVKSGKIKLIDVLRINRLYYFSSVDLSDMEKKYNEKMKMIVEEDNRILQSGNKLKKLDPSSKKAQELITKIETSRQKIRQGVFDLGVNENEINKVSSKMQSMVNRIKETYDLFGGIEKKYNKDLKELKHYARRLEKGDEVGKILKELRIKHKEELLNIVKDVRNNERKIRWVNAPSLCKLLQLLDTKIRQCRQVTD